MVVILNLSKMLGEAMFGLCQPLPYGTIIAPHPKRLGGYSFLSQLRGDPMFGQEHTVRTYQLKRRRLKQLRRSFQLLDPLPPINYKIPTLPGETIKELLICWLVPLQQQEAITRMGSHAIAKLCFLLAVVSLSHLVHGATFNVKNYGVKGDGKSDDTQVGRYT